MKKLFIFILSIMFAVSVFAVDGNDRLTSIALISNTGAGDDSAAFEYHYNIDIPDNVRADTLFMYVWAYSEEAGIDLDFSVFSGMHATSGLFKSNLYKWSADSQIVKATFTTESSVRVFRVVPATPDTLIVPGDGAVKILFDAIKLGVLGGGSSNSHDTEYIVKVMGIKEDE